VHKFNKNFHLTYFLALKMSVGGSKEVVTATSADWQDDETNVVFEVPRIVMEPCNMIILQYASHPQEIYFTCKNVSNVHADRPLRNW
jgi:hypothetical protein